MRKQLKAFVHDDSGATSIEYALLAGLIAVAIAGVVIDLGSSMRVFYYSVASALGSTVTP